MKKLPEQIPALEGLTPGKALDLACGKGGHARWLAARGWEVTAVDVTPQCDGGVHRVIRADLERGEFTIAPDSWDLIVCWRYWQEDLLPAIARGVRPGGVVALAGKTTGRFATSLERYRKVFGGWKELASDEDESFVFLVVQRAVRRAAQRA